MITVGAGVISSTCNLLSFSIATNRNACIHHGSIQEEKEYRMSSAWMHLLLGE